MDNYQIARDRAQEYFLQFDQDRIICRWNLRHNENYLFTEFIGRPYRICRQTGQVDRLIDGKQAGFSEVLSIFDQLCYEGKDRFLTGRYAPVNSLRGRPPAAGVGTDLYTKTADFFGRNEASFCKACIALGGVPVAMGDLGFRLPLFGEMDVILKFYRSDDEFPATVTFLYDENTLSFMRYETVFYVAGFILEAICEMMNSEGGGI
ncbi:MAG: DUF3786 domain-containing protein [Ruminococcaceae bacterium]|nr:DUF3786 domain-containing protein [Oscillospiraceae bacterium]